MNALTEMPFVAERFTPEGSPLIDCHVDKIFYGDFLAVRDSHVPIEKNKITAFIASVTFPVGRGWFLPDPFVKNLLL